MQEFRFKLLDKNLINKFIRTLHRPEPSGYGTLPPDSMNTAWGVEETYSSIILTKSYEAPSREWKGKKGEHRIGFDVSSSDGLFYASFDTNIYGDFCDSIKFYGSGYTSYLESKYKEIVESTICYYMHDGHKNGDFVKFANEFETTYGESLPHFENRMFQKFYEQWKNKWKNKL